MIVQLGSRPSCLPACLLAYQSAYLREWVCPGRPRALQHLAATTIRSLLGAPAAAAAAAATAPTRAVPIRSDPSLMRMRVLRVADAGDAEAGDAVAEGGHGGGGSRGQGGLEEGQACRGEEGSAVGRMTGHLLANGVNEQSNVIFHDWTILVVPDVDG